LRSKKIEHKTQTKNGSKQALASIANIKIPVISANKNSTIEAMNKLGTVMQPI